MSTITFAVRGNEHYNINFNPATREATSKTEGKFDVSKKTNTDGTSFFEIKKDGIVISTVPQNQIEGGVAFLWKSQDSYQLIPCGSLKQLEIAKNTNSNGNDFNELMKWAHVIARLPQHKGTPLYAIAGSISHRAKKAEITNTEFAKKYLINVLESRIAEKNPDNTGAISAELSKYNDPFTILATAQKIESPKSVSEPAVDPTTDADDNNEPRVAANSEGPTKPVVKPKYAAPSQPSISPSKKRGTISMPRSGAGVSKLLNESGIKKGKLGIMNGPETISWDTQWKETHTATYIVAKNRKSLVKIVEQLHDVKGFDRTKYDLHLLTNEIGPNSTDAAQKVADLSYGISQKASQFNSIQTERPATNGLGYLKRGHRQLVSRVSKRYVIMITPKGSQPNIGKLHEAVITRLGYTPHFDGGEIDSMTTVVSGK